MYSLSELKDNLSEASVENLKIWLENSKYSGLKNQIIELIEAKDWRELEDSFFKVLEFGTAGRRGKVGVGCNRINEITIGESVQALAEYLIQADLTENGVVIAHDTRNSSRKFAELSAEILAENDIKTYLFDNYRSTPELSFAVRHLGAASGIVISASHNPPEDNGIKVYWSDGAQISKPHDKNLMEIANKVDRIRTGDYIESVKSGKIEIIGKKIDQAYILANANLSLSENRNLKIVYSPLHGAGITNLYNTLTEAGFNDIELVEPQITPDGDFPFVAENKPNPENPRANEMAIDLLKRTNSDIAITTDPDSDRVCVISMEKDGKVKSFNGNESAILATNYVLKRNKELGRLSEKDFIAKTIVTTDAMNALAEKYGVKIYDNMLVGFKYIARTILEKSLNGENFLIGAEESYGQLIGDQTRDKDAATAGLILAEYAADLKADGRTLAEESKLIYDEIGYFKEKTLALEFAGADGFLKMKNFMQKLHSGEFDFDKIGATAVLDYENLTKTDLGNGEKVVFDCTDTGNVIVAEFENDHRKRLTIRPSGTEPKLKIYAQWFGKNPTEVRAEMEKILDKIKAEVEK